MYTSSLTVDQILDTYYAVHKPRFVQRVLSDEPREAIGHDVRAVVLELGGGMEHVLLAVQDLAETIKLLKP